MDIEQIKRIQDHLAKTTRVLVTLSDLVAKQQPRDLVYLEDATRELQLVAELLLRTANGYNDLEPSSGTWPALFALDAGIDRS